MALTWPHVRFTQHFVQAWDNSASVKPDEVASFGPQGEVKVITALRSGKILSELARRSPKEAAKKQPQEEKNLEDVAKNLEKIIKEPQHFVFPRVVIKPKKTYYNEELLNLFKQVENSLPLGCDQAGTPNHKVSIHKKAFLVEQISVMIQQHFHVKYKDPGCLTITTLRR